MTRGIWDRETVALLLVAALLPVTVMWLRYGGIDAALLCINVLLILVIWQLVFLLARAQAPSVSALATALAIAIFAPELASRLNVTALLPFASASAKKMGD